MSIDQQPEVSIQEALEKLEASVTEMMAELARLQEKIAQRETAAELREEAVPVTTS